LILPDGQHANSFLKHQQGEMDAVDDASSKLKAPCRNRINVQRVTIARQKGKVLALLKANAALSDHYRT
jgi:hypothetical protein